MHENRVVKMKEFSKAFIEAGIRIGKGAGTQASPARSPLPIARRATGTTVPAMDNSQIAEILDSEDALAGHSPAA